jgi:hypothetical protein
MKKYLVWVVLILAGLLLLGMMAGCEDEDGEDGVVDSGTGGEGIANPIPDNHFETDCDTTSCHGPGGFLPLPDNDDHDTASEEDCGSCHF